MKKIYPNPIVMRSKAQLLQALLTLMEEKNFYKITVKELTKRAELDRKTFYRHFQTKEDVLFWHMEEACENYLTKLQALSQFNSYTVSEAYFSVCFEYMTFFKILNKNNLLGIMFTKFDNYLSTLNQFFSNHPSYRNKSEYELYYQSGGFWNVTQHWIEKGAIESIEEMALITSQIMPSLSG